MNEESDSQPLTDEREWKKWERELNAADEHEKDWREKARKILKRYRDERDAKDNDVTRFNILFSNTEVLKGAVYQRLPVPEVRRRFDDKDPVGKAACDVLDRCLTYASDAYDFHGALESVRDDSLLPGRGVARVKYVPQVQEVGGVEQVVYEEVRCEYHDWEMFRYSPAKRWDKVRWVAFGDLLTRDDLVSQFGPIGEEVKLDWKPDHLAEDCHEVHKRAIVWSIWDKTSKKLKVWCSGYNKALLAKVDDPLRLEQFFPCPRPVYTVYTTNSLIPVPEYTEYQDQAVELDELTGRITALTDALRFRGVYDKNHPELGSLAKAGDTEFIPVENIAALAEKGGLDNAFMQLPIEGIGKVLEGLYVQREQVKQTIYEITGISDILRGSSESDETATAQQIKAQYGGLRIKNRQGEMQRFARDILRLKAEVMAEHFSPQTLQQISGVKLPSQQEKAMAQQALMQAQATGQQPDPRAIKVMELPSWDEVLALIKDDKMRGFRIDVETDSTIQPDQQMEQQSRIEAITGFGAMLQHMVPAVQLGLMPPEMAQKSIAWVIRSFKNPGELEEVLDKMADQPPQPMGPSPEEVKELERREQEVQAATQKLQEDGMALTTEKAKFDGERHVFGAEKQAAMTELQAQKERIKFEQEKLAHMESMAVNAVKGEAAVFQAKQQAAKAAQPKRAA